MTTVDLRAIFDGEVSAIIINHGDHAYAKVHFDERTLETFMKRLSSFDEYLERDVVWRQLWIAVMDGHFSSLKFIDLVKTQLPNETVEQTLADTLMKLSSLISNYVPSENVLDSSKTIMETLLSCLVKYRTDNSICGPLVDNLMPFIQAPEHVELAISWIKKKHIHLAGSEEAIYDLTPSHIYTALKTVIKSSALTEKEKAELMETTLAHDKTDSAKNMRLVSRAATTDPKEKENIWIDLTSSNTSLSVYERISLMGGFWCSDQKELKAIYTEKFYEHLADQKFQHEHTFKYITAFLNNMLPRADIKDEHIVKLMQIKLEVPDTDKMYANQLQDCLETLLRCKKVRARAKI